MKACVLKGGQGPYTNLKIEEIKEPNNIGDDDVLIQHTAIGVNFDDIMYRRGDYPIPEELISPVLVSFFVVTI